MNIVSVRCLQKNIISLEWPGNALNDTIADSVLAIILAAENSPVSIKCKPLLLKNIIYNIE